MKISYLLFNFAKIAEDVLGQEGHNVGKVMKVVFSVDAIHVALGTDELPVTARKLNTIMVLFSCLATRAHLQGHFNDVQQLPHPDASDQVGLVVVRIFQVPGGPKYV